MWLIPLIYVKKLTVESFLLPVRESQRSALLCSVQKTGSVQFISFSSRWYLCARKSPYALHPVSREFSYSCLWNGCNVRLTDDSPLSSCQGRSFSASSLNASLLQAISGVMVLALCQQVLSQASQHFISSEKQATSLFIASSLNLWG